MNITPHFQDNTTQRIWQSYFARLAKLLSALPKKDGEELLLEFKSHLYESFGQSQAPSEPERLLDAIEKMGQPEDFIRPIIAEKLLDTGTKTYNPRHILKGLLLNATTNSWWALATCLFYALYSIVTLLVIITFLKLIFPENTGFFVHPSGYWMYGYVDDLDGYQEQLGYWIIPIHLAVALLIYFINTMLLRFTLVRKIRKG